MIYKMDSEISKSFENNMDKGYYSAVTGSIESVMENINMRNVINNIYENLELSIMNANNIC